LSSESSACREGAFVFTSSSLTGEFNEETINMEERENVPGVFFAFGSKALNLTNDWCGPASDLSAGHRQAPHEKKTGARNRKITACARRKEGGKKKMLFHGNVCAYLTCLLIGDPRL